MNEAIRKLKDVPYNLNNILEELRNNTGSSPVGELNMFKQTVNSSELINNNGLFEVTINHNMNSEITSVLVKSIDTRETVDFSCIEIDNNSAKIIISESIDIEVLLLGKNMVTETPTSESIQFSHEEFNATNVRDALVENKTSIQEAKTDISSIQNELENLKQLANSGKSRIASAIGTPLSESDTFIQMEEKINTLTSNFRNKLINKGVEVIETEKISSLIGKIDIIKNITFPSWYNTEGFWLNATNMTTVREGFTSSAVGNNIYCIGGYNNGYVNNTECYNAITNTWTTKASITTVRYYLKSSVVGNNIYCMGGSNRNTLSNNECYNTTTNTWTTKANMINASEYFALSTVGNNIYCIGGNNNHLNKNECYDTITNTWTTKTNMITGRQGLTSGVVGNNIYCIGGFHGDYLNKNECYDTTTNTWTTKANMITGREGLTSGVVGNNIYCIGGSNTSSNYNIYLNNNECYDVTTNTWTTKTNMVTTRYGLTSGVVGNNIYCIGGSNRNALSNNECYIS